MRVMITQRGESGRLEVIRLDCDLIVVGKNRIIEEGIDCRTAARAYADQEREVCHELFNHMAQSLLSIAYDPSKQPNDNLPGWKPE